MLRTLLILLFLPLLALQALAEKRIALVIGINDYKEVPKLEKAVGDAKAVGEKLKTLGFQVTEVLDVDRRQFNLALSKFYGLIEPGDTVLVHYSGHGVELQGQNYLLPTDVPAPTDGSADLLKAETIGLQGLVETLVDKGAGARILIIDACRNNPFAGGGKRAIGGSRGLAKVDVTRGTFIMYSAGIGQTALDRLGDQDPSPTSVYTRVLLKRFDQPGVTLRDLASSVREDVFNMAKSVGQEQYPAYYDEMPSNFVLNGTLATPVQPVPTVVVEPVTPPAAKDINLSEDQAYKLAESINTVDGWKIFLVQYPTGAFAPYAKAARAKLITAALPKPKPPKQEAVLAPTPKPIPPKPVIPPPKPEIEVASDGCDRTGTVRGLPAGGEFLSVRTGPAIGFAEVDRLFNSDSLSICGQQGKWFRVKYSNGRGWVNSRYIAISR
jgi:Caspase domain/Bacterial SH3 domain